jgi:ADP-ribosylglycohydrolase
MEEGIHWRKGGDPRPKGCGSAMRASPIGYLYQNHPGKLKEVAHASGTCTHGHPAADAASIGVAYLVKLALDGLTMERMIPELLAFTKGISGEWDEAILKVEKCLAREDEEKALAYLGEGWVGEEAVALALYCFLRYPEDYRKTVVRGANTNGDSDSIACIAGSISGAYLGIGAIPEGWTQEIERSVYLADLAGRLALKRQEIDDDE